MRIDKKTSKEIPEFPELKEGEIFVSHVGDGEYSFNIFGSAHTNMDKFIEKLEEMYKEELKIIWKKYTNKFYIVQEYTNPKGKIIFLPVAFITIEKIDPEDFPID